MTKKVYVGIEVIKILILYWTVGIVYNAYISSDCQDLELLVIGRTFLIMLVTLVISSIILDILVSFFITVENQNRGEWEKIIDKNILRNFTYMLSVFFIVLMIFFALDRSINQIISILRVGFFFLVSTNNLTKAYYYVE